VFGASITAWYFAPDGELRACIATLLDGRVVGVIDTDTLEVVDIPSDDVLIEKPE